MGGAVAIPRAHTLKGQILSTERNSAHCLSTAVGATSTNAPKLRIVACDLHQPGDYVPKAKWAGEAGGGRARARKVQTRRRPDAAATSEPRHIFVGHKAAIASRRGEELGTANFVTPFERCRRAALSRNRPTNA